MLPVFYLGSTVQRKTVLETNEHLWGDDASHVKVAVALEYIQCAYHSV